MHRDSISRYVNVGMCRTFFGGYYRHLPDLFAMTIGICRTFFDLPMPTLSQPDAVKEGSAEGSTNTCIQIDMYKQRRADCGPPACQKNYTREIRRPEPSVDESMREQIKLANVGQKVRGPAAECRANACRSPLPAVVRRSGGAGTATYPRLRTAQTLAMSTWRPRHALRRDPW